LGRALAIRDLVAINVVLFVEVNVENSIEIKKFSHKKTDPRIGFL
jgi:hypothetical protein